MTSALAKTPAAIASLALIALLSGCGGGEGANSKYCKDYAAAQPVSALKSIGEENTPDVFKSIHELAAESPKGLKDDWDVFEPAIAKIEKAFKDAGIGPRELVQLKKGEIPEGVKVEKLQGLPAKFNALDEPAIAKAQKEIVTYARDVCMIAAEQ